MYNNSGLIPYCVADYIVNYDIQSISVRPTDWHFYIWDGNAQKADRLFWSFNYIGISDLGGGSLEDSITLTNFNEGLTTVMISELSPVPEGDNSAGDIYRSFAESSVTANNGQMIQSGSGKTKSLFDNSFNAISSGILLQRKIDSYNMAKDSNKPPLLASILISTEDFYNSWNSLPDVMASGIPAIDFYPSYGEVFISGDLFKTLEGGTDFIFRMETERSLPNSTQSLKLYKLLFDKHEISAEKNHASGRTLKQDDTKTKSRLRIIATVVAVPALIVIIVTIISWHKRNSSSLYKRHSITHTAKGNLDAK